jgi:general L-amino acid transport system substrate-binding protein
LRRFRVILALLGVAVTFDAWAGETLDRIHHDNVVRCAAEEYPGLAAPGSNGGIEGIAVDLCRAVAIAVLGCAGRVVFTLDAPAQDVDLAFLAVNESTARGPLLPGPLVFMKRLSVLVPRTSAIRNLRGLAGETVCLMIGSPEQNALEAKVRRLGINITRLTFEEDVEMHDAYAVGRCGAMIGTSPTLSSFRGPLGINKLTSRLVRESLALMPVVAVSGSGDREWTAAAFRTINAVLSRQSRPVSLRATDRAAPPEGRQTWRKEIGNLCKARIPGQG